MSIVKSFSFPCGELRGDTFYIQHNSNNFTVSKQSPKRRIA